MYWIQQWRTQEKQTPALNEQNFKNLLAGLNLSYVLEEQLKSGLHRATGLVCGGVCLCQGRQIGLERLGVLADHSRATKSGLGTH